MNKYQYRKENGLCVSCGDRAVPGRTRCIGCLQVAAAKQKIRYQERGEEYRKAKYEYVKKWQKNNPERMEVYKSRKSEYNKRYLWSGVYAKGDQKKVVTDDY